MSESVTITMPVPPKCLSPNGRSHWRAKAKAIKHQRQLAWAHITCEQVQAMHLKGKWLSATVLVRWFGRTHGCLRLDSDNIIGSLKGAIDGLADAELLKNDRGVTWLPPERAVDKANPRVELVVTRTTPAAGTEASK